MSDYTAPDNDIPPEQDVRVSTTGKDGEALRASDSERDAALHLLAAHYADGRLDRAEFDQRADTALAARTRDQLRTLFADLPGPRPVPATTSELDTSRVSDRVAAAAASAAARARGRGALAPSFPLAVLAPLLLVFAVLAALHGAPPFPLIPLLFILSRRHRRWNREARPWI